MTQAEIFDKGIKENIVEFENILDIDKRTPEEIERLSKILECYNKSIYIMKVNDFDEEQKKAFLDIVKQEYYNYSKLLFVASCVKHLYKNNDPDTKEKLDLLVSEKDDEKRMSQMYIAIVKDLTPDEMREIKLSRTEDIVEKTKEVFRKHYNIESLDDVIREASKDIEIPNTFEDITLEK